MSNFGEGDDDDLQIPNYVHVNPNNEHRFHSAVGEKTTDLSIPKLSWHYPKEDSDSDATCFSEYENRSNSRDDRRVSPSILTDDDILSFSSPIPKQNEDHWNTIINSIVNNPDIFPEDCDEVASNDMFSQTQNIFLQDEIPIISREQTFRNEEMVSLFAFVDDQSTRAPQTLNQVQQVTPDSACQNPLTKFTIPGAGSELSHNQEIDQLIHTTSEQNNSEGLLSSNDTQKMNIETEVTNLSQPYSHISLSCNSERKYIEKEKSLKMLKNKKSAGEVKSKLKHQKKNGLRKSKVIREALLKEVITNSASNKMNKSSSTRYSLRNRRSFSEELPGDETLGETAHITRTSWSHPMTRKSQLRNRIEHIQMEVRRWLNGFDPPMDKSHVQRLIAEVQEIQRTVKMNLQESRGFKHQDIQEFSQVTEKLMFQLHTGVASLNIEDEACSSCCETTIGAEDLDDAESSDSPEIVYSNITNPISSPTTMSIPNLSASDGKIMENELSHAGSIFNPRKEKKLPVSEMPSASLTAKSIPNLSTSNEKNIQRLQNSPNNEALDTDFISVNLRENEFPIQQNSSANKESYINQMCSISLENYPKSNLLFTLIPENDNLVSTSSNTSCKKKIYVVLHKNKHISQDTSKQEDTDNTTGCNQMGTNQTNSTEDVNNISNTGEELSSVTQSKTISKHAQLNMPSTSFECNMNKELQNNFNHKKITKNGSKRQTNNVIILNQKAKFSTSNDVPVNDASIWTQKSSRKTKSDASSKTVQFNHTPFSSHQNNACNVSHFTLKNQNFHPDVLKLMDVNIATESLNQKEKKMLMNSENHKIKTTSRTIQKSLHPTQSTSTFNNIVYNSLPPSSHKGNADKKSQTVLKKTGARKPNHKPPISSESSASNTYNTVHKTYTSTANEFLVPSQDFLTQTQTSEEVDITKNGFTHMEGFTIHSNLRSKEHSDETVNNMGAKQKVTSDDIAMQTDEPATHQSYSNMDSSTSHELIQKNFASSPSQPIGNFCGEPTEQSSFVFGITKVWLHSATEFIPNSQLPEGFWENENAPFPQDILDALEDW